MAKKSKSAAPSPDTHQISSHQPSSQPQEAQQYPIQQMTSQHTPPNAQPIPADLVSPKPLLKAAKEKSSGGENKELWLIQVPRNVNVQSLEGMQIDWPDPEEDAHGEQSKVQSQRTAAQPCSVQGIPYTLVTQDMGGSGGGHLESTQGKGSTFMVPVVLQTGAEMVPVDRRMILVKGQAHIEETDKEEEQRDQILLREVTEISKAGGVPLQQQQEQREQGQASHHDRKASKKAKRAQREQQAQQQGQQQQQQAPHQEHKASKKAQQQERQQQEQQQQQQQQQQQEQQQQQQQQQQAPHQDHKASKKAKRAQREQQARQQQVEEQRHGAGAGGDSYSHFSRGDSSHPSSHFSRGDSSHPTPPISTGVQGQGGAGSGYALSDDSEADRTARKKQKKEKRAAEQASTEPGHQQQNEAEKGKKAHKEVESADKKKKRKTDRRE
ncbi:hypothetical protein DUNSADRAFT_11677 [Dunaliella salina]|uniref:Uncharacterized protein n=1 Tax=Dunaliella salina TaxID=3046 RepID=A0ABQ7H4B7_DUNSA|nr:hypothetical protein DUNSADRAFT_11677 [Dunaliella salina]|eukprot:KAF5841703.1 hypothetical protein DUNSADRAFT_11677 [Dunaliella salina]